MRLAQFFVILCICFFMGACHISSPMPHQIDIGDYENQLEAWNNWNLPDYRLRLSYYYRDKRGYNTKGAVITVKNGIPESSDPPEWLAGGEMSTVSEFFSFIRKEKDNLMNTEASADPEAVLHLYTSYNTVYHYPAGISLSYGGFPGFGWNWGIDLLPMAEYVQVSWDRLNMPDYKLRVEYYDYLNKRPLKEAVITVKNGIPESSDPPEWLAGGEKSTVPDFFSFLKEEEIKWGGVHPPKDRLMVGYDIAYHYPYHISAPGYRWDITLTPGETE